MKPDYIYIQGKKHTIQYYDGLAVSDEKPLSGHNDATTQVVTVNKNQHADGIADTLLHEFIHLIDYNVQIGLEEKQVHTLASVILEMVWDKRNEKLMRKIFRL